MLVFSMPEPSELQPADTVPIKKPEAREQARLVAGLRKHWAQLDEYERPLVWHIPNGGSRNALEAGNLKTQGVLPGVPDLEIAAPGNVTVRIEMKALSGRVSSAQTGIHRQLAAMGHHVITAYSAEDALQQLRNLR